MVETVCDGKRGLEKTFSTEYDLVVLDVMLPGLSGFEVLREIRKKSDIPVLMLTARGDEVDRIVGLEMGADDYLPKPFNPRELVARIRAIMRRIATDSDEKAGATTPQRLIVGDIELDTGSRSTYRKGQLIELTSVEFALLRTLLKSAGRVVSRDYLVKTVLGRELSPYDRSIDVHISNLRKKIHDETDEAERIRAVRGEGYLYALPDEY
jgi:two-component system response regulator CpxR